MSETVTTTDWERLCESQMQRALAGDAKAAAWVAAHKPAASGESAMPSIEYISKLDLSKLSVDQLRALAGEDTDVLVQTWKALLCVDCRLKLLARIEDEAEQHGRTLPRLTT